MQRVSLMFIALGLVLLTCSCNGGSSSASSASTPIISINGQTITAAEMVKSPFVRAGLVQQIMYSSMQTELAKNNISVDTSEIDKRMADTKAQVEANGQTWNAYLAQNGLREEELRQRMEAEMQWKALIDGMVEITDEDVQQYWEERQSMFVEQYMREHHLPESEMADVTLEDVRYLIEDYIKMEQAYQYQEQLMQQITDSTDFQILCLADEKEAELYEFLIYGNRKSDEVEGSEAPEGVGEAADDSPAGIGATSGGAGAETTDPEGETAPEGEGEAAPEGEGEAAPEGEGEAEGEAEKAPEGSSETAGGM